MSKEMSLQDVLRIYMESKEVSDTPTEEYMKNVMQSYIDNINKKDAEAIINLFADNSSVEDPVGTKPIVGIESIKSFQKDGLAVMKKAELVAPIRTSPGNSAAMVFTIHMDFGEQEVIIKVIDIMKFDEAGKIVELKAYWGKDDVQIIRGELKDFLANFMENTEVSKTPTDEHMRNVMQNHIDLINKKVTATPFMDNFADNALGADPVGTKPLQITKGFSLEDSLPVGKKAELVAPIRTSFGNSAAMAFDLDLEFEGQEVNIQIIDVMKFDEAGKIIEVMAYWGKDNVKVIK
ncbi:MULTISPECIES: nuclear transport factor 2 family protein [unclassified Bacillus (in: firmicutes)]|uniref:nuclear transport factor 2 family protein n=1 Tax=unclassified Bacillus (in: firmicutes) TaxID=185979 RepID=UPI00227DD189|nr:nuclear transport factor 2 family protein [Bacillus sp. S20C3]MCY8289639.1 nuclear transport factor 2 family protein [Bacillus sp. N13C7]MCY8638390.1 nuclear transport factor 2 family protein [Bacillus sp. S17B2]MCY9144107.1 nuclear transport factor 2 family protein [Bacillus sp. T9C1]